MTAPEHSRDIPQPINGHGGRAEVTTSAPHRTTTPRSRVGEVWVAAVLFALILLLLLIFLLQNSQRVEVSFFGAHGQLPMGVALLLAAVFGMLLVALPGTARIAQLRMLSRRRAAAGRRTAPADEPASR